MLGFSLLTILGLLSGLGLFIGTIVLSTDNYFIFLSIPSALMVIGGTLAATLVSFHGNSVFKALGEMLHVIIPSPVNEALLFSDIRQIINWSRIVASEGMPSLELQLQEDQKKLSPFLNYATEMLFHGYRGEFLRSVLENSVMTKESYNLRSVVVLNRMASIAPAFGMIGTLIGMIIMLDHLESDPQQIGVGLAVALITTLYGTLFAQLIFKPTASKLQEKIKLETHRDKLLIEGFVALVEEHEPLQIQDNLNSFLKTSNHFCLITDKSIGEYHE